MIKNQSMPLNFQDNDLNDHLIKLAFEEDLGLPFCDITTQTLFKNDGMAKASIISKHHEPIVLCGLALLPKLFKYFNAPITLNSPYHDGDFIQPDATLITLHGSANILLMVERTMLNFLQHLSAVATLTKKFTQKISHTSTQILDTRKTLPGFRHLDKYAVRCGGGVNHRMGLYDAVMIKDTHVDALGGMEKALNTLPDDILKHYPVIIEVRNKEELQHVLTIGLNKTTRVLLDNMTIQELTECVQLCKKIIPTEASGNIDLENVVNIAETGVNFVSIGKLTHSAGNVNLSMRCHLS